ncbi:MAG: hypothetical protein V2I82_15825 [Halieaceae bacterium]|nr:hypothetical protein [Halieaceae bacterium]
MARKNYSFEKRQRELAKKNKKDEKRQQKAEARRMKTEGDAVDDAPATDAHGEQDSSA